VRRRACHSAAIERGPNAATFASLTKTLADVKSYIVPGGTADNILSVEAFSPFA
jgi:hypothetical protein